jgi:two-component system, NtrC family, sensor kinase
LNNKNAISQTNEAGQLICDVEKAERERENFEVDYKSLFDLAPDGIIKADLKGYINSCNDAFSKITGYSKEEIIGKHFTKLPTLKLINISNYTKIFSSILNGKTLKQFTFKWIDKEGNDRFGEAHVALTKVGGKITGIMAILRDVTEREKSSEALRNSEKHLRVYLEAAPDAVYLSDLKGTFLYGNKKAEEITGYYKEELLGQNFLKLNLLPTKYLIKAVDLLALNAIGISTRPEEIELITKAGNKIWVEISTTPITQQGKTIIIGFVRDISERKKAEDALRESEERWQCIFNNSPVSIGISDMAGKPISANLQMQNITGYPLEELVKINLADTFVDKEEKKRLINLLQKKGIVTDFETRLIRKDGSIYFALLNVTVIHSGGKGYHLTTCIDITERRRIQEKVIEQDRLASIGRLSSGIAHEINNPLTSIITFSNLLLRGELRDDMKEDLKTINDEAKRAANIVKNLLTFARQQPREKRLFSVNEAILKVLELLAYEQKMNNIIVNFNLDPNLPQILGNNSQIQQVFYNIIINAEFSMVNAHRKGNLTIITEKVDSCVRTTFTDDGPGIIKENMRHLFTPFFTTKEVGKGTGLGLSICHGIITEHSGRIWAESEIGKGSSFIVELPI